MATKTRLPVWAKIHSKKCGLHRVYVAHDERHEHPLGPEWTSQDDAEAFARELENTIARGIGEAIRSVANNRQRTPSELRAIASEVDVVRTVLIGHLRTLAKWPPGLPGDYAPDFEIGECSALDHCDNIVQWMQGGAR